MLCHMAGMVVEEGKEKRGAVKQKATPNTGTRPVTVNRTIKLRLLARPPVPVSTAISGNES